MAKKEKSKGKKHPAESLPAQRPRKSGKRGIGPIDRDETSPVTPANTEMELPVDEPNVKEDSTAANNLSEQPAKSNPKKEPPKQLLKVAKQPTPAIQNDRMSMHFIGFRAHRQKDRTRVVTMKFSLELQSDHEGRLPKPIEKEWTHFQRGTSKYIGVEGVHTQKVSMSIASDQDGFEFTADVPFVELTRVVEKGKGQARSVTRLEIHFLTTYTTDTDKFCRNCFDETVWGTIEESQDSLFGDEDDDE
jgi:hypothetical protein